MLQTARHFFFVNLDIILPQDLQIAIRTAALFDLLKTFFPNADAFKKQCTCVVPTVIQESRAITFVFESELEALGTKPFATKSREKFCTMPWHDFVADSGPLFVSFRVSGLITRSRSGSYSLSGNRLDASNIPRFFFQASPRFATLCYCIALPVSHSHVMTILS